MTGAIGPGRVARGALDGVGAAAAAGGRRSPFASLFQLLSPLLFLARHRYHRYRVRVLPRVHRLQRLLRILCGVLFLCRFVPPWARRALNVAAGRSLFIRSSGDVTSDSQDRPGGDWVSLVTRGFGNRGGASRRGSRARRVLRRRLRGRRLAAHLVRFAITRTKRAVPCATVSSDSQR